MKDILIDLWFLEYEYIGIHRVIFGFGFIIGKNEAGYLVQYFGTEKPHKETFIKFLSMTLFVDKSLEFYKDFDEAAKLINES